jgi:hypothetical protein
MTINLQKIALVAKGANILNIYLVSGRLSMKWKCVKLFFDFPCSGEKQQQSSLKMTVF